MSKELSTETKTEVAARPAGGGISYKPIEVRQSSGGGGVLTPRNFGEVVAFAEMMAKSQHAIPAHLRNNPGACCAVTLQAMRWEMDPFVVASKSYNVKDLIAYEAQLIAALVHTRAPIKRRPDYEFSGKGPDLRCTVSVEMLDGTTKVYQSPRVGDIKTKNSPLWVADTEQQLGYFSIRSWARRHTPEVLLGVYTPDELADHSSIGPDRARDVTPPKPSLASRLKPAEASTSTEGFSTEHVDRETGEILDTDPAAAIEEQDPTETADPDQNNDDLPDDRALIDHGRAAAMDGTAALLRWRKGLTDAEREEIKADIAALSAVAKQADGVVA
jgi:hypothetical protein